MRRILIAWVAIPLCCAAIGLTACGGGSSKGSPGPQGPEDPNPLTWTCDNFDQVPPADYERAINELVAGNQLGSGRRDALVAQIKAICDQGGRYTKPASQAVEEVSRQASAPGSEDPGADDGGGGGGVPGPPPSDLGRSEPRDSEPPSAPPAGPPPDEGPDGAPPHDQGGGSGGDPQHPR